MQPDFDVAIAGAGATGATLAIGLARAGYGVLLVDPQPDPAAARRDDGRGLALAHAALALLARLGVWPRLESRSCPIHRVHVSQLGHYGALRLDREDLGLSALGHVCPAAALAEGLGAALAEAPGLTVRWGTALAGSQDQGAERRLTLNGAGRVEECTAALLVGADGSDSAVRRLCGIEAAREVYGQTAIVSAVDASAPRPHEACERFTPTGPLALLPMGGARYVLVHTVREAAAPALLACPDTEFAALTRVRFGSRLGSLAMVGPRRAYPLFRQRAQALTAARAVLVGNAANTLHPNAAQGLNLGFRDVATLLDVLDEARLRGTDPGQPALLADYASRRATDQRAMRVLTDVLARSFRDAAAPAGLLRAAALVAADRLPPLRQQLLRWLAVGEGRAA